MQKEYPTVVAEEESASYGNTVFMEDAVEAAMSFPHTPQTEEELDKELTAPHLYLSPEQSLQTLASWSLA